MAHLFAKGVPDAFNDCFGHKGEEEAPVARDLSDIASASLLWPSVTGQRADRSDRPVRSSWCGATRTQLLVPGLIERWGGGEVIAGAGDLLEWDAS